MTATWLDVLLTPRAVEPTPNASARALSLQEATAMLLDGHGRRLEDFREQSDLPTEADPTSPESALWLGADSYHAGDLERALDLFLRASSATSAPADLRTTASILAAIASSDLRRHDRALTVIESSLAQLQEEMDLRPVTAEPLLRQSTAVLTLHLGWRLAEVGRWQDAVRTTEAAASLVADDDAPVARAVSYVAELNLFRFRFRSGRVTMNHLDALQRREPQQPLQEPTLRMAASLTTLVEETVEDRLAGPFTSGIRWVAEDEVARGLWSAVLRSECLADDNAIRATRRHRAMAQTLVALEAGDDMPAAALCGLRESGAAKELSRAARWYLRRGPLTTLPDEVAWVARSDWLAMHEQASLTLLGAAGELVPPQDADAVLERLLAIVEGGGGLANGQTYRADLAALEALPNTLQAASAESQSAVARRLLALVPETASRPPLAHALPRVLTVLRWSSLDATVLAGWKDAAAEISTEGGDLLQVSASVVSVLSHTEPEWARQVAMAAYHEDDRPRWAAVLVDMDVPMPDDLAADVASSATERIRQERDQAARGRYSKGGIHDALLLTALVLQRPEVPGWQHVCDYLGDPHVDIDDKEPVANLIASRRDVVDEAMRTQLAAAVEAGVRGRGVWDLADQDREAVGAGLRLSFAFGFGTPENLRESLLALAHEKEAADRIEACWTLPYATDLGPSVAPLALHLTYDQHHEVRAAAAASSLRVSTEIETRDEDMALIRNRMRTLMTDPGVAVPWSVLRTLSRTDGEVARRYVPAVTTLSTEHAAGSVRRSAAMLLERLAH